MVASAVSAGTMIVMPKVTYAGADYPLAEGESVLDALLRGGANVPFSCRKGTCHVCMMQVTRGEAGDGATRGLRSDLVDAGMCLPCCAHPAQDLEVAVPEPDAVFVEALLAEKRWLNDEVCALSFEASLSWKPGQFVNIRHEDCVRSYSIASVQEEDYFLTIHVQRVPQGRMSTWLLDTVEPGQAVWMRGPVGHCYYDVPDPDADVVLLATGSGIAPLVGVCRDALRQGHRGTLSLYHGARTTDGLYLDDTLRAMAAEYPNFAYHPCTSGEDAAGTTRGRVVAHALPPGASFEQRYVYLCGSPDMVADARVAAVAAGVKRDRVRADPFEFAHAPAPRDKAILETLPGMPMVWDALERGPKLSAILTTFYDRVYQDARLAPFFHKVTKRRAIEQQFAFLADLFRGERKYFGLKPFNAHHWMVISDALFDYREEMLEACMREHGLPEPVIRAWGAMQERFRRDIVKASARGLVLDGVEQPLQPAESVTVEFAGLCDGCQAEMNVGDAATYVHRTGQLYCASCGNPEAH